MTANCLAVMQDSKTAAMREFDERKRGKASAARGGPRESAVRRITCGRILAPPPNFVGGTFWENPFGTKTPPVWRDFGVMRPILHCEIRRINGLFFN
ncbi:MAG: hypothetical protein COS41_00160 [Elusimicrobia bacterium CG03_land_8_20_14_0_80_50_18]|nr:MAG: hypothetical protein COS41_00160 [Elusimicrobia bacterium CG03_land_8_20_14_0_80_50_18]